MESVIFCQDQKAFSCVAHSVFLGYTTAIGSKHTVVIFVLEFPSDPIIYIDDKKNI